MKIKSSKILLIILSNSVILLLLLFLIEFISIIIYNNSFKKKDPNLIRPSWSNYINEYYTKPTESRLEISINATKHLEDDKKILPGKFSSQYQITESGYRFTPSISSQTNKNILFLGCSFTFGEGVNDNETLPYYFQEQNPTYKAINLGVSGYGPIEALDHLRRIDDIIPDSKSINAPIGIFLFFSDHINRTALNSSHMMWSVLRNLQVPILDNNNNVTDIKFLREAQPYKYLAYSLLQTSRFFRILFLKLAAENNPTNEMMKYSKEDEEYTFFVLKNIEKEFYKRFPKGKFYIYTLDYKRVAQAEIPLLNKDMNYFSGSRLPDGHYDAQGNRTLAKEISELLFSKR